jgi:DNA polymerase III epsilon subunit-like protein
VDNLIITARTARRPDAGVGLLAQYPFVAIDLETTGSSAGMHRIVEIAGIKMLPSGEVIDRFSHIVNPGDDVPLPRSAERIHQIRPHQIRSAPPVNDVLVSFAEFIGNCGVVAHQLSFENQFLTAAYQRIDMPTPTWQGLCTLAMARKFLNSPCNKLGYLLELLGLGGANNHRAADDAAACGALAAHLISRLNISDLTPLTADRRSPTAGPPTAASAAGADTADCLDRAAHLITTTLGATMLTSSAMPQPQVDATSPTTDVHEPVADDNLLADDRDDRGPAAACSAATLRDAFGGFAPTDEQLTAVDAFTSGASTKLVAVAGAGKTATLLGIARLEQHRNPHRRGLYLAFNKSVAAEAAKTFPSSVTAMTAHRLARTNLLNTPHGALLGKLGERVQWRTTADAIYPAKTVVDMPDGRKLFSSYVVGRYALRAVEEFCKTLDTAIGIQHMPDITGIARGSEQEQQLAEAVIPCAVRAWRNMLDPSSFAVQFTHSCYLKLFADTQPKIGRDGDYILLDEAQDSNPVISSIFAGQTHLQQVLVGDANQAIYGFTGAVDALSKFSTDRDVTLTQSWRFGEAIADAANVYLRRLRSPVLVRGNPQIDDAVDFTLTDTAAVLSRTNGGAINEIMRTQKAGATAALVGDVEGALRFCSAARSLQKGATPNEAQFAVFSTWGQLEEYIEHQPGMSDLATQAKLVNDYGVDAIEHALQNLVAPSRADTVFVTCHKAKGLQFKQVRIAEDFENPAANTDSKQFPLSPAEIQAEQRLAYVALTRAQHALNPGQLLQPRHLRFHRDAPTGMLL